MIRAPCEANSSLPAARHLTQTEAWRPLSPTPRRLSERTDIDMTAQRREAAVRGNAATEQWVANLAEQMSVSRGDHRTFLLLLIGEARRYHFEHAAMSAYPTLPSTNVGTDQASACEASRRPYGIVSPDLTDARIVDQLVDMVGFAMADSCATDNYVPLRQRLAALSLFRLRTQLSLTPPVSPSTSPCVRLDAAPSAVEAF